MKTIYLKELESGNFRLTNEHNFTHSFEDEEQFRSFFHSLRFVRIIKYTYLFSQTYFRSANEVIKYNEKQSVNYENLLNLHKKQ